jgi:hypothetical protein
MKTKKITFLEGELLHSETRMAAPAEFQSDRGITDANRIPVKKL